MDSKLNEAHELLVIGNKCLKTSFLKRKPDYDSAIENYAKAALIFKSCRKLQEAAKTYRTLAELYFKTGSFYHCAKQYEAAALMYRDLKDFQQMASLISDAGQLLRQNGTPDSASYVYERAAKCLEEPLPEKAAEFYERSADACEIEEKFHEAADQANNAARIWVRLKKFSNAERLLRLYIDYIIKANPNSVGANVAGFADFAAAPKQCGRAATVMILIKLYQEDEVAAKKIYSEAIERWRYAEAEEYIPVKQLLAAVDESDKKACLVAIKAPCFRNLDLDYARLAREINFPYSDVTEEVTNNLNSELSQFSSQIDCNNNLVNEVAPNQLSNESSVEPCTEAQNNEEEEEDIC